MTKYKLWLPGPGEYLRMDDGEYIFVAATAEEAHRMFDEYSGPEEWVHPVVLRGHVLYKRDIDAGDCHEDAEPGDSTFSTVISGDSEAALAHDLAANEVLAWESGPPRPWWTYGWNGTGYEAVVGKDTLDVFASTEAANEAVKAEVEKRVQAWKDTHPQFHMALPTPATVLEPTVTEDGHA